MKKIQLFVLCLVCFTAIGCKTSKDTITNKKYINKDNEQVLIGRITPDALFQEEYSDWFLEEYNSYIPDPKIIKKLKGRINLYTIEVFFGTWSDDSRIMIPQLLKILKEVHYPERRLRMFAVNEKNQSFYGEDIHKNIKTIPTIIIYRNYDEKNGIRNEVGRIIQEPSENLEMNLYKNIDYFGSRKKKGKNKN